MILTTPETKALTYINTDGAGPTFTNHNPQLDFIHVFKLDFLISCMYSVCSTIIS